MSWNPTGWIPDGWIPDGWFPESAQSQEVTFNVGKKNATFDVNEKNSQFATTGIARTIRASGKQATFLVT